jgi:flavodoxin
MLVAYFSWGGNTRRVAEVIHGKVGGEIFEIAPLKPYSEDYDKCLAEANQEKRSRAKIELKAAISPEEMRKHKVVFVGYPNWLQAIPRPVGTFLEAFDWTGKIIMPFCTHGGGRLGQTEAELSKLCPKAKIVRSLAVFKDGGEALSDELDEWLSAVEGESA